MALVSGYGLGVYGQSVYGGVGTLLPFKYEAEDGAVIDVQLPFSYASTGELDARLPYKYQANGILVKLLSYKYATPTTVAVQLPFQYSSSNELMVKLPFQYSMSQISTLLPFKYSAQQPIEAILEFNYAAITAALDDYLGGSPQDYGEPTGKAGEGTAPLQGSIQGNNVANRAIRFTVTFNESKPAEWSLEIDPVEFGTELSDLDEPADGTISSNLTWYDQPFIFYGVPTGYTTTCDWKRFDNWVMNWSGADKSHPIFTTEKTYATKRSEDSKVQAKTIIGEILEDNDITSYTLKFQDFAVPVMHLQDARPIDFIKSLLEIRGAEWRMDGNTFVAWVPGQGVASWNYSLDPEDENALQVLQVSLQSDFKDMKNTIVVARTVEANTEATSESIDENSEGYEFTFTTFGSANVSFPEVIDLPFHRIREEHLGFFSNITYYDVNGNAVSRTLDTTGAFPAIVGKPAYRVQGAELTFGAQPGVLASEGFGRIVFFGNKAQTAALFAGDNGISDVEEGFVITAKCQDYIDRYYENKEEVSPSPLIPNKTVATDFATQILRRKMSERIKSTYLVPLNPVLKVGDKIREVIPQYNIDRISYVEQVSHNFELDTDSCVTQFTCRYYEPCEITIIEGSQEEEE